MPDDLETRTVEQVRAVEVLTNYMRKLGSAIPLDPGLIQVIYHHLCNIPEVDRDRFTDLARNVAAFYAREVSADLLRLTELKVRQGKETAIIPLPHLASPTKRPMDILLLSRAVESPGLRGRLNDLCRLYNLPLAQHDTNPAPKS